MHDFTHFSVYGTMETVVVCRSKPEDSQASILEYLYDRIGGVGVEETGNVEVIAFHPEQRKSQELVRY